LDRETRSSHDLRNPRATRAPWPTGGDSGPDWYWRRWPKANIGLLTDELVDVLDVDGPQGHAALSRWAAEHRLRLYSLIAGGVLDSAEVEAGLRSAAEASRLLEEEPAQTRRTLASAERTGMAHPRGIPLRSVPDGPASADQRASRDRSERERDA
jgi:hypothetical protein